MMEQDAAGVKKGFLAALGLGREWIDHVYLIDGKPMADAALCVALTKANN
ncbi:MAG: hypothetical protein QOK39_2675 [Acidimicrobiaceae bacterium]|jgi:hypothetical protein|nr:hypothetical protein [Acidimicrobiaceae bacterium]